MYSYVELDKKKLCIGSIRSSNMAVVRPRPFR
jgi:hypothetical protein